MSYDPEQNLKIGNLMAKELPVALSNRIAGTLKANSCWVLFFEDCMVLEVQLVFPLEAHILLRPRKCHGCIRTGGEAEDRMRAKPVKNRAAMSSTPGGAAIPIGSLQAF